LDLFGHITLVMDGVGFTQSEVGIVVGDDLKI
jgi:hypothetical protein